MDIEQKFQELFKYVFAESYNKIDNILQDQKINNSLTKENNNYYRKMLLLNPNVDIKIIKAYCFTIYYMLILTLNPKNSKTAKILKHINI